MKYGKVLTYKDVEEAQKLIGKKVVFSNYLFDIEKCHEDCDTAILNEIRRDNSYLFTTSKGHFQFIREIIEEEPQFMTNRQLSEWCGKRNGVFTYPNSDFVYTDYPYRKAKPDELVPVDIRIRSWDSEEWVIPTVDIYERDCK